MFHEGQQIGPYVLIRKLGTGGFGAVWLAERRSQFLTKKVAVKLPHDEQVNFDAIKREAGLWEDASGHPNVLPIIDADIYDGQVVIVSEFADGGSLADKLKGLGTTSVRDAVEVTMGILAGLQFLHDRKIIHRDVKPQNILLQGNTPRLADFGISRAMQTTAISSTIIGTDAYMSPEAFDGKRSVQTDIWSVGVVLYELLNGRLPFPQEHPSERMFAVLTKDFEPLPNDIPVALREIVSKALAKLPENRFSSATEMRAALENVLLGIAHPTLAKTEVFDPGSMPFAATEAVVDPEATVVRQRIVTTPMPLASNPSLATQVAPNDRIAARPAPGGTGAKQPLVIIGALVGILVLVLAIFGLRAIISRNRNSAGNTNAYYSNYNSMVANAMNAAANAMNSASNRTNTSNYSSNAYPYPSNSSNSYSSNTSSNISRLANGDSPGTTFCDGYAYGWRDTYRARLGANYSPPSPPPCPASMGDINDNSKGQLMGTIAAIGRIKENK